MNVLYNPEHFPVPCAATVGFFDGVHCGHQFLIDELKKTAAEQHLQSAVITFTEHPRKVLNSDFQPKLLTTPREKLALLQQTGIDNCILLDFTAELSQFSAREFIKEILFEKFNVKTLLIGYDHRFGHQRSESFEDYLRYGNEIGLQAIQASKYENAVFQNISSSAIRLALQNGETEKANAMLGYRYSLEGEVIHGQQQGRKMGFPTANMAVAPEKLVPQAGVYAVKVEYDGKTFGGMLNIGYRPTFNSNAELSVETHIFDFSQEIYGENIKIHLLAKIRNERKFDSPQMLAEQLKKDKENCLLHLIISAK